MIRERPILKRFVLSLVIGVVAMCLAAPPTQAQSIIRDREIEKIFSTWFTPVIEAAELNPKAVNVILVQDSQINAFVAGGPNVFFFTGLLMETDSPGEIIGVMAHELGHIRGGHLIRGRQAMERASYETLIGTILGLGIFFQKAASQPRGYQLPKCRIYADPPSDGQPDCRSC